MSTYISNAYKLSTSNFSKVDKKNKEMRKYFSDIVISSYKSEVSRYAVNALDFYLNEKIPFDIINFESKNKEIKPYSLESFVKYSSYFDYQKDSAYINSIKRNEFEILNFLGNIFFETKLKEFSVKVNFVNKGKNTYYILNIGKSIKKFDALDFIQKLNLEDFEYQDQSDKPDDISSKNWNNRKHIWNSIFYKTPMISEVMYSFEQNLDTKWLDVNDILEYIADDDKRLQFIYKKISLYELFQNKNIDDPNKLKISEYSDIVYDHSIEVKDNILAGKHLESRYKDLLIPREELIYKIENHNFQLK